MEDFHKHQSEWVDPVSTTYRGHTVWELPPNGQGIATLQILNILEGYPVSKWGLGSADLLHHFIEAKKLAFEDRARFYADPDFFDVPVARLLSKKYASEQRERIDGSKAALSIDTGQIVEFLALAVPVEKTHIRRVFQNDAKDLAVKAFRFCWARRLLSSGEKLGVGEIPDLIESCADLISLFPVLLDPGQLFLAEVFSSHPLSPADIPEEKVEQSIAVVVCHADLRSRSTVGEDALLLAFPVEEPSSRDQFLRGVQFTNSPGTAPPVEPDSSISVAHKQIIVAITIPIGNARRGVAAFNPDLLPSSLYRHRFPEFGITRGSRVLVEKNIAADRSCEKVEVCIPIPIVGEDHRGTPRIEV